MNVYRPAVQLLIKKLWPIRLPSQSESDASLVTTLLAISRHKRPAGYSDQPLFIKVHIPESSLHFFFLFLNIFSMRFLKPALHCRQGLSVGLFLQNYCRLNQNQQDVLVRYFASTGKYPSDNRDFAEYRHADLFFDPGGSL